MVEKRNAYRLPVGKPEGKKPLRKPRHKSQVEAFLNSVLNL
jgi:hypothetical protein